MGGFVEHCRAFVAYELLKSFAPFSSSGRQKSLEAESPAGQSTAHQGRGCCTWPWDADHLVSSLPCRCCKILAWIADAGETGITDDSEAHSLVEFVQQMR